MKVSLVLVRTEYASNVGSAARALANMGGDRLILIDPQCDFEDVPARQMAAGAQTSLQDLKTYPNWEDFLKVEGEGLRIALTRRGGKNRKVSAFETKLAELARLSPPEHLYLILGPEADGLDATDLGFAHFACHLPVFGEFGSLNLSQAALLALYLARAQFKPEQAVARLTKKVRRWRSRLRAR